MNKELIVDIPYGYEIDRSLSTFEKIVFKQAIKPEVDNWLETFEGRPMIGFYVDSLSNIKPINSDACSGITMKNTFPTIELAKKSLAMSQLSMLIRDMYNKRENSASVAIVVNNGRIVSVQLYDRDAVANLLRSRDNVIDEMLLFDSYGDASSFITKHRHLICDYFMIKN